MEVTNVSYPQIAVPVSPGDSIDAPPRRQALEAMLLEFIGLLKELRKTLDEVQAQNKCVSLELLQAFKKEQLALRDERMSSQKWQAAGHMISGFAGIVAGVGGGIAGKLGGRGIALGMDTAAHVGGALGSTANGVTGWVGSDRNYKADEAQTGSDLAKEAMSSSDGAAGKSGDESARTREDYLSQLRALMQELTAFVKATVR